MDTEKPKKKVDEATLRRLAEGRLKGLETRRKRAELKKQEKAEQREKLDKEYETKILKKKEPSNELIEETTEEIYANTLHNNVVSESEEEAPIKKTTRKPAKVVHQDATPNYKQEYYRVKLEKLRNAHDENQFVHQYARLPTYAHMADVAKSQITNKVNQEVLSRVYKDLFGT